MMRRNILQLARRFAEEVVMIGRVGVEIRAAGLDDRLAQQPDLGKLVQGVVNRRERYWDPCGQRFAMQKLGGDVTVPALEQEPGECEALTGRPQPGRAQATESG